MITNVEFPPNPFKMTTLFEAGMAKKDAGKIVRGKLDEDGMELLHAFVDEILTHKETEMHRTMIFYGKIRFSTEIYLIFEILKFSKF